MGGAISVLFMFVQPPQLQVDPVVRQDLPVREMVAILAALVGVAVARASGGWRAVGLLAAVLAVNEVKGYGVMQWSCARFLRGVPAGSLVESQNVCPSAARFVGLEIPRAIAGLAGLLVAPVIAGRRDRPSALLIAAAIPPIWFVLQQLATLPLPLRANDISASMALIVIGALMWALVGATLRILGGAPRAVLVLALTLVPPTAFGIRLALVNQATGFIWGMQLLAIGSNIAFVVVLVLGWALSGPPLPLGRPMHHPHQIDS